LIQEHDVGFVLGQLVEGLGVIERTGNLVTLVLEMQ
jgi:hypothetical protein